MEFSADTRTNADGWGACGGGGGAPNAATACQDGAVQRAACNRRSSGDCRDSTTGQKGNSRWRDSRVPSNIFGEHKIGYNRPDPSHNDGIRKRRTKSYSRAETGIWRRVHTRSLVQSRGKDFALRRPDTAARYPCRISGISKAGAAKISCAAIRILYYLQASPAPCLKVLGIFLPARNALPGEAGGLISDLRCRTQF